MPFLTIIQKKMAAYHAEAIFGIFWRVGGDECYFIPYSVLTVEADRRVHIDLLLYRFLKIAALCSWQWASRIGPYDDGPKMHVW